MKRILAVLIVLILVFSLAAAYAEEGTIWTTQIIAHFADEEEGRQLMRNRTLFHEQINEKSLDFLLQRKGGTLEEYIEYSADQVMAFTPEEEQRVNDTLAWLQHLLEHHGLLLPDPGEITFVKSTSQEAFGSAGYTSEGNIFLAWFAYSPDYYDDEMFRSVVVHELSHCLSRKYPEYREALYSLVNFTILDRDIEVPEEIRSQIIANPDVEHHDNCAEFTIGGEKKECYLVFLTDSNFEKPGDTFFSGMYSGVVPLDGSGVYRVEEVDDVWEVVGRNTDYVEDPEELMATNLAYALVYLENGYAGFKSPEILEGIIEYLGTRGKE